MIIILEFSQPFSPEFLSLIEIDGEAEREREERDIDRERKRQRQIVGEKTRGERQRGRKGK